MKILNTDSLCATVENFDAAYRIGLDWEVEFAELVEWISSRLGQAGSYAGSFAMTDKDWERTFKLHTGEKLTTKAVRSHVMAQETMRILRIMEQQTGKYIDALHTSEVRLTERIFSIEAYNTQHTGFYCCGCCSVSFWRALNVGNYPQHQEVLAKGLETLVGHRDGPMGWKRFPLYYTLLLLSEVDQIDIDRTIGHVDWLIQRRRLLASKRDSLSQRRHEIIDALLKRNVVNQ